jgi:hypothetical protein
MDEECPVQGGCREPHIRVRTRPDITFAVSTHSQFLDNPGEAHWDAVKCVFHYLSEMKALALTYGGECHNLIGTDADECDAGAQEGHLGQHISRWRWCHAMELVQTRVVTLLTAEAEYVAAIHAAKEGIWLHRLIGKLFVPITSPTTLYCDNQAM